MSVGSSRTRTLHREGARNARKTRVYDREEKVWGARFDRNTLEHAKPAPGLTVTSVRFIKHDPYQLIDGVRSR